MRLPPAVIFLLPALLFGAGSPATVRVTAQVPIVAAVEGPAQLVLAPGEVARVPVQVAANLPWVLGVRSPNAWVEISARLEGPPGGTNENRRELVIACSAQASGPQVIPLVYTLVTR